jgi:hypothetical protein
MAMNFAGLGFNFSANGRGLLDFFGKSEKGASGLGSAMGKLNELVTQNKLATFIQSISLSRLNDIASGIENIGQEGMNLTTGFEAELTASRKSTLAFGANIGKSGKDLQKFSGDAVNMGISLNIGAESAGKAMYGFEAATGAFKAMGVDSAATLAKVSEVYGVNVQDLGWKLNAVQKAVGLTDESLGSISSAFLAAGKHMGNVGGAMEDLQAVLPIIKDEFAASGQTLTEMQLADHARQVAQLGAAFYELSGDSGEAMGASKELAQTLVTAQKNIQGMFAGTENDMDNFHTTLGTLGINVDESFKMMKEGPANFVQGMADMVKGLKEKGNFEQYAGFLQEHLEKAIGAGPAKLMMEGWRKSGKDITETMKTIGKSTDKLGKSAKEAYTDGRTLSQQYDLIQDQFVARLRRTSSAGANFVKDSRAAFKRWGDSISEVAKDKGPLGSVTRKFIEMSQIGAAALLPENLRPLGAVAGKVIKELTPLVGVIGSLGIKASDVVSPFGLLTAGIAGFGYTFYNAFSMTDKQWDKWTTGVLTTIDNWLNSITDWLDGTPGQFSDKWGKAWDKAVVFLKKIPWGRIWETIKKLLVKGWDTLKDFFVGIWEGFTDPKKALSGSMASKLGGFIGSFLKKAWETVKATFRGIVAGFWGDSLSPEDKDSTAAQIGQKIGDVLKTAWETVKTFAKGLWAGLWGNPVGDSGAASTLGATIGTFIKNAFWAAVTYVTQAIDDWWDGIWKNNSLSIWGKITATFGGVGKAIVAGLAIAAITGAISPILSLTKAVTGLAGGMWDLGKGMVNAVEKAGGFAGIGGSMTKGVNGIKGFMSGPGGKLLGAASGVAAAGLIGYELGSWFNEQTGASDKIADALAPTVTHATGYEGRTPEQKRAWQEKWAREQAQASMLPAGAGVLDPTRVVAPFSMATVGKGTAAGTASAASATVKDASKAIPSALKKAGEKGDLLSATNAPTWYVGDYRQLFMDRMDKLTAVIALRRGAGGPAERGLGSSNG